MKEIALMRASLFIGNRSNQSLVSKKKKRKDTNYKRFKNIILPYEKGRLNIPIAM